MRAVSFAMPSALSTSLFSEPSQPCHTHLLYLCLNPPTSP